MYFPQGFVWGAASASYQIEGAWDACGKAPSIWDVFSHTEGKIYANQNGDIACDAFHRFGEDLRLMADLGIMNYRFSISWPRIISDVEGSVNAQGLAFYDRVINLCLELGITPWVTLYHWDLPQYLEDKGGWLCRDTAIAFQNYAHVVGEHFAGRVQNYFTINEPQCFIGLGYYTGQHAPGKKLSKSECALAMHHALLAHGLATRALKSYDPSCKVGLASTGKICYPDAPEHEQAAMAEMFRQSMEDDFFSSHPFSLDAPLLGKYPEEISSLLPSSHMADLDIIATPTDFVGLNVYNGNEFGAHGYIPRHDGYPRTALKWPVTPECLGYGAKFLYMRYGLPIYITENGQSCNDRIYADGKVHDPDRMDFLFGYLSSMGKAIGQGVDIRGYFHWSFSDNFEWHSGYEDRFGLVYVDYRNQRRIPKDSAIWYGQICRKNKMEYPTWSHL